MRNPLWVLRRECTKSLLWIFLLAMIAGQTGCSATSADGGQASQNDKRVAVPAEVWVETLDLTLMEQGWGEPHACKSVEEKPITINGQVYEHGVGTHSVSEMSIDLHGQASRFRAFVGIDDETDGKGSVVFIVVRDGKEIWKSDVIRGKQPAQEVTVNLTGAKRMTMVVECANDGLYCDHANWADAKIEMSPNAVRAPVAVKFDAGPPPQISMKVSPRPHINAPRITGATPGLPFLFRIPVSGKRPMKFEVEGLPTGLQLDSDTGIITGSLEQAGTTKVALTVSNSRGKDRSTLTIVGGEHKLALTPPMGWNSWNAWGRSVDDAKVRAAADWMARSGLADFGYQYINIDDAWEAGRDDEGNILTNEKFPDMKALADYVHSKGLKLGIYSSPGPKTCAGYEGSYQHEYQDAKTFAEWGIDLIKYDWCSYGKIAADESEPELRKPYELMRKALDACGRDIVFSLCQYGMGDVHTWGEDVGGDYWRTTGDIVDTWPSMSYIGFSQAGREEYAGPGHWNDPDMLVVGKVGWGPDLHETRLTQHEQITHITLWSLLASPLLIGCDLSDMEPFTLAILTNPEVIEVSQNPLGRQAGRVKAKDDLEVWARPLADGTMAVGLFNRGRESRTITLNFADLNLSGPQQLRDLWKRTDVGTFNDSYSTDIPRHGAVMLKVISK